MSVLQEGNLNTFTGQESSQLQKENNFPAAKENPATVAMGVLRHFCCREALFLLL